MIETTIIFYSWQSDLPRETNQTVLRQSIRSANNLIEDDIDNIRIELDEATRETTGSPNIPQSIFSKISKSDIFICDLTTINADSEKRKVPNPNVLIELGYAIAVLGWERIIMLFNTNYGSFPTDLPFDIDRHRTSDFKITNKADKNGKNQLIQLLKVAIKPIIEKKPLKPEEEKALSPKERKRKLDINNLTWIMSSLNIQIFDDFLDNMPTTLIARALYFKDWFCDIARSNKFHLYDKELSRLIYNFRDNWDKSFSYYKYYTPDYYGKSYKFQIPFDVFPDKKTEDDFNELTKICLELRKNFEDLLSFIRNNYLEVDLEETSQNAFDHYLNDMENKN